MPGECTKTVYPISYQIHKNSVYSKRIDSTIEIFKFQTIMSNQTILIIEDEASIREVEAAYLKQAGYKIIERENGTNVKITIADNSVDLVLLDLNLPGMDGLEICKNIRSFSKIPIVMVTARNEEIDELKGLNLGADDYIKKPFSPAIMVARIQRLLKGEKNKKIKASDLIIDPEKMKVNQGNKEITLTSTEFNILYILANTPGRVFERSEIIDKAYDNPIMSDVMDRTVDAHIKSIRKKLNDENKYIITIIGRGYKFKE